MNPGEDSYTRKVSIGRSKCSFDRTLASDILERHWAPLNPKLLHRKSPHKLWRVWNAVSLKVWMWDRNILTIFLRYDSRDPDNQNPQRVVKGGT